MHLYNYTIINYNCFNVSISTFHQVFTGGLLEKVASGDLAGRVQDKEFNFEAPGKKRCDPVSKT